MLYLQAKKSAIAIELDGARRTIQALQQQLASKQAEADVEVDRVKADMDKRVKQLEKECEQVVIFFNVETEYQYQIC